MNRSIKAQVIALAKNDPFLTVVDLAQQADTSTSYVRTILSEAQLSLNDLRREYARRLERSIATKQTGLVEIDRELRIMKVAAEEVRPQVADWLGQSLFQASSPQSIGSEFGYARLITPQVLNFVEDYVNLRDLLPKFISERLEVIEQSAEIITAPHELAQLLNLPKFSQVLQLTTILGHHTAPVAIETKWVGAEGLVLRWSKKDPELRLSESG